MAKKNQNKLAIKEVQDDVVVFEDGSMVAVLQVHPAETSTLSAAQKRQILAGYRFWLENLSYPVQICARTVNLELEHSLEKYRANVEVAIKKRKEYGDALREFTEFYSWLEQYVQENGMSRRVYYLVIPYLPFFRKKKELKKHTGKVEHMKILRQRITETQQCFKIIGLDTHRCSDKELINLYSSFFTFSLHNEQGYYDTIESCVHTWLGGNT
ncbi:TPA: hypothetical protein HA278_06760 [Candidatus Woesearchaeota archaeon]|nr:hypothetical protein [Candidatus Woesearchaeota archaeon]